MTARPGRGRLARLPRPLHPGAWWVWALGLATAASGTSNPLLLALLAVVTGYVVAARRTPTPWARSYAAFARLALAILVIRVGLEIVFGVSGGTTVLVRLPQVPLPGWLGGIRLGGAVTLEGVAGAAYDGLRLAVLLVCLGAANALAGPTRLLRVLPGALYEAGVAVTVAMSFAPQAVVSVGRVRAARRLRGRPDRGVAGLRGLAIPVLEGALERSVQLAAAMDARGYGRRGSVSSRRRHTVAGLTLTGLLAVCASCYGLLGASAPALLGLPLLVGGALSLAAGLSLGGRRSLRSRYRPDPWSWPEWVVAGSGVATAVIFAFTGTAVLHPSTLPLVVPPLSALALGGTLLGLLPAWVAPPVPRSRPMGVPAPASPTGSVVGATR